MQNRLWCTIKRMITITDIKARQILDSRGNPTMECDVHLSDGAWGRAAVPSGASTGSREAIELRDGGEAYGGKAVQTAVRHIHEDIRPLLMGKDPFDQRGCDTAMREADGTDNKSHFGANAILAVSLALAHAAAHSSGIPLHQYVATLAGTTERQLLPLPMMNIMNGGAHAAWVTDFQEYMIVPTGAGSIAEAVEMGANVFHALKKILAAAGYQTTVGDEGGYAPRLTGGNREPLTYIMQAIQTAGYTPGRDISLALDAAASEFYRDGAYQIATEQRACSGEEMIAYYQQLASEYPIISIEDGLDESDWPHWAQLTSQLGGSVQLVGDDLLVTNTALLQKAIDERAANAILIKPNQIGSLSETIDAVLLAQQHGWRTVMSHRSGETEDTTIAHLAVALGTGQIKTGSLSRTDRVAKYNELLRIAEQSPELKLAAPFRQNTA